MTIDTLFGPETLSKKPRVIKFKSIKAVYETMTLSISEDITNYISPSTRYTSPIQIFESFKFLQQETKEYFISIHLDGKNRILCIDIVSVGSLNQSIVSPRETFKTALLSSAAAIILIHNHPSGDPVSSSEDISITRRLKEAGDLLGIRILDHIIIGDNYLSFVERGLL
jgi:DNA repair protein RadC